ncbi:hypothetical protein WA026_022297 [Henosepilachna vigintioctopunctata]|uniref:Uncharacterized protein n=1 Tax=Henosepilachna vigintioctopunctata TaxID=420089 RepID=A0AAW1VJ92_9CUCU
MENNCEGIKSKSLSLKHNNKVRDGTIVDDPQSIADMLRDHFNIPAVPHGCPAVGCGIGIPTLFLHPVDEDELRSVIDNLRTSTLQDWMKFQLLFCSTYQLV